MKLFYFEEEILWLIVRFAGMRFSQSHAFGKLDIVLYWAARLLDIRALRHVFQLDRRKEHGPCNTAFSVFTFWWVTMHY